MFSGLISAGLGLVSSIFGGANSRKQEAAAGQGFDYLKNNGLVNAAQSTGQHGLQRADQAGGLYGALLGLGGDQQAANDAFNQYKDSTGYQFRMDQGLRGITDSRAAQGVLNSGATSKALMDYGQGMASREFSNYLGQLGNAQQFGNQQGSLGLRSALGVGYEGSQAGAARAGIANANAQNQMASLGGITRGLLGASTPPSGLGGYSAPSSSPFGAANPVASIWGF